MASTTPRVQSHYVDFDEYVDSKLKGTRDAIRSTDVMSALVASSVLLLAYLILFVVADHWIGTRFLPPTTRLVLGFTILGAALAWSGWRIGLPHRRRISRLFAAREIEESEPTLESNLLNLVDLQNAEREVPKGVIQSIEKRAAIGLSQTNLDSTVDRRQLMRTSYVLLGFVVLSCVYTLFSPKPIGPSLLRAFGSFSAVPTRTRIEQVQVQTAGTDTQADAATSPLVPAGFQPLITAVIRGALAEEDHVTLYYTTSDERFVDQPLEMKPVSEALATFASREYSTTLIGENDRGLLQDLRFHIEAGDARTENFTIRVSTAPSTTVHSVDFTYPDYMQLDPESRDGGNVDAWEGTTVTIHATASRPVRSARLAFSDTEDTTQRAEEIAMRITDGTKLTGQWRLAFRSRDQEDFSKFYRIVCKNNDGAIDLRPTLHSIAIRADKPPQVELLAPRQDLVLSANAVLPLLIRARDPDFQLRYLTLRVEKDGKELVEHNRELFAGHRAVFGPTSIDFPLEPLGLTAGDTISYWIEARDNKTPVGNRTNTAPKLNIRITKPVSPEEAQKQHDEARKKQDQALKEEASRQEDEDRGAPPPEDADPEQQDPEQPDPADGNKPPPNAPENNPDKPKNADSEPEGGNDPAQTQAKGSEQKDNSSKDEPSNKGQTKGRASGSDKRSKPTAQQPLNNDGSDDDEAIKRIRDHQRKQNSRNNQSQPDAEPKSDPSEPPQSDKTGDKGPSPDGRKKGNGDTSNKDKPGAKSAPKPSSVPMKKSGRPKRSADGMPPDKKSTPENPKTGKADPSTKKDGQPSPADEKSPGSTPRKPGSKSADSAKKSKSGDDGPSRKSSKPSKPGQTDPKVKDNPGSKSAKKGPGQSGDGTKKGSSGKKRSGAVKNGKKNSSSNDSAKPSPSSNKPSAKTPKGDSPSKGKKGGSSKKGGSKAGNKSTQGKPSSEGTKPGTGSAGKQTKTGSGGTGNRPGPTGQGEDPTAKDDGGRGQPKPPGAQPEPVHEEFTKEAANLVLKRIDDTLKRGEVDPDLLKQLGWNEQDMRKFSSRLRKHVNTPDSDTSPEATARRRQFEEMLRSVNVPSRGAKRLGRSERTRGTDALNAQDLPVPLQFREAVKLYRRNLTRRKSKPAPPRSSGTR